MKKIIKFFKQLFNIQTFETISNISIKTIILLNNCIPGCSIKNLKLKYFEGETNEYNIEQGKSQIFTLNTNKKPSYIIIYCNIDNYDYTKAIDINNKTNFITINITSELLNLCIN